MKPAHSLLTITLAFTLTAVIWSCGTKEAPAPEDENELITTVRLTFTHLAARAARRRRQCPNNVTDYLKSKPQLQSRC